MAREKLLINEIVDPLAARVIVDEGAGDPDLVARFDVAGVPRVDGFLVGKQAAAVPTMVTRLCGLCPVTHHLTGIGALDQLVGVAPDAGARQVRLLMHHGSVLDVMGPRLAAPRGRADAVALRMLGKKVLALAGVPGHFPDVATPGGVRVAALPGNQEELREEIRQALPAARGIVEGLLAEAGEDPLGWQAYEGADVVVANERGEWDPLGGYIRVTYNGKAELVPAAAVPARIRETAPGSITPRPQLLFDGQWLAYRVGPAARYPGLAVAKAQAKSLLDSLDAIGELLKGPLAKPGEGVALDATHDGSGVGLVDGPRGLLVHHYTVEDGVLVRCEILSPTAQNEPWLAAMLSRAYREGAGAEAMELAVRAADPCLPCTQAPPGMMNIQVVRAGE